jgi:PAS domain S-box-containing protein
MTMVLSAVPIAPNFSDFSMTVLERLLQPVWEVSSEAIVVTTNEPDPNDRKILYVNQAFTRVNGYTKEEAIGQPLALVHGSETDPAILRKSEEQLREGRSQEYSVLHYRKDGSHYQCITTRAPLVDANGKSEYLISIWRVVAEARPTGADKVWQPGSVPLTLPMPLHELRLGQHPRHLPSHPELDALKALWVEVCGERALPNRRDFDLDVMKRWAAHVSIAVVTPDGRFQFRLFGTELANVYGRDLTGCFLDELTPNDLWLVVILHYQEVVRTRQPLFAPISISNGRWYTEVSRLLLPLSANSHVNFIMSADYKRDYL